jgi:UDP-N-acetylglucosamine 2-epimerase (non-hydrolysing)
MIDIIAGARPNFMKIAPIIRAIEARGTLHYRLVHTGQHYDERMSASFFEQLGIPAPHINLEVGSGTQAQQTAGIMIRYEELLQRQPAELCLVVGDVTSTMACAIVAQKAGVPVAHVEAGIRSNDWTMPEEINRIVTDSLTNYFFTTSEIANQNLRDAGVPDDRIYFVGNTMIDTLLANLARLQAPSFWDTLDLRAGGYFVVTLHRPSNVDDVDRLDTLLSQIDTGCGGLPVLFPVHPRTAGTLRSAERKYAHIHFVEPQPYLEFNYMVKHALGVITDSGGITEETTVLNVPCVTIRNSTERPETVQLGTNELVGTDPTAVRPALAKMLAGSWKRGQVPPKWDGKTAERIVLILEEILNAAPRTAADSSAKTPARA